jgi:prolyl 4-hydroxylase
MLNGTNDDFNRAIEAAKLGTFSRARKLFERAALAGVVQAEVELGLLALHGVHGNTDVLAATEHFDRAARLHNADAHLWLAQLAVSDPAPRLPGAFFQHFAFAVHANHPRALSALGIATGSAAALAKAASLGDRLSALLVEPLKGSMSLNGERLIGELEQNLAQPYRAVPARLGQSVRTFDAVLSELQCRCLRELARPTLAPALVRDPQSGQAIRSPIRSNRATILPAAHGHLAVRLIERTLASIAGQALLNAEDLGILHYGEQQEYRPHRDYLHDPALIGPGTPGQRAQTIFCYLNEPALGGETEFLHWNQRVNPKLGRVVCFDNMLDGKPDPNSVHAGLPVLAGEKWLATLWLRERRVRAW